jgi:hypothetical protein
MDERILLKLIVNLGLHGIDSLGSGYRQVAGENKHGDKIGSHRMWGIFCLPNEQIASYGLCSTMLVIELII